MLIGPGNQEIPQDEPNCVIGPSWNYMHLSNKTTEVQKKKVTPCCRIVPPIMKKTDDPYEPLLQTKMSHFNCSEAHWIPEEDTLLLA